MQDVIKVRKLLEATKAIAFHLTDDEITALARIIDIACTRLIKEQEGDISETN
jgi:hypothetical protein